jgi:hypothetical protein
MAVSSLSRFSFAMPAENKKSPLFASGPESFAALDLDGGPSLPVAPVRKSPRVGIERGRHVAESTEITAKRKPECV